MSKVVKGEAMRIETSRFGYIDVDEKEVISFVEPILGFPNSRRYVLLKEGQSAPFFWLQSADKPDLAFVVTNPLLFVPDYRIKIYKKQLEGIKLDDLSKGEVWTLVSIRKQPLRVSINLQGPILVNKELSLAKQIVLDPESYPLQYDILRVNLREEKVEA